VILQENKSDSVLLRLVGFLLTLNYDARNHELKTKLINLLLEVDRQWMISQKAVNVGVGDFSVHHIIRNISRIQNIASCWVPQHLT